MEAVGKESAPGALLQRVRVGGAGGVCVCACAWPSGEQMSLLGKDSPAWDLLSSLAASELGLAPRPHPSPLCYLQKHPHAFPQDMAGATAVSRCFTHFALPILLHGEHALGGRQGAPDAPRGQAGKEGPSWDAFSAPSPAVLPKEPCCSRSPHHLCCSHVPLSLPPPSLPPGHFYEACRAV